MLRYLIFRIIQVLPVLFVASIAIWGMIFLIPGDPVALKLGPDATLQQLESAREDLGLNDSLLIQYVRWLSGVFAGNLGISFANELPVSSLIAERLPATLHLVFGTALVSVMVSVPLALLGVSSPNRALRKSVSGYISLALAVPSFLIGVILVFIFGVNLSLLPTGGYIPIWEDFGESIRHLILPIATMSFFFSGLLTRFLKSSLLSERSAEYVDTARSKGVPKKRIWRNHILRNALLPGITVFGLYVGTLFAGAVITESIFNFPGVGRMLLDAVRARDYPVMQGTILLVVVLFVVVNLLVDLLYAILDPRIRYSK
jgi:peptide/nickel transport system permease protein